MAAVELLPFAAKTEAIAPMVVVAIAQAAISVAGLFSHGGSGLESLLQLQVEMLNHIEGELGVIEQQIQQMLGQAVANYSYDNANRLTQISQGTSTTVSFTSATCR